MLHKTLKLGVEAIWILGLGVDDLLIDVHGVVIEEWGMASMHLVDQDAEGPPIDWLRVSLVEEDLGSNVFWSATNSVSSFLDNFGETVIDELEVSIVADHDVFWLQVSVDDVFAMEVLEY